jgi:feruloyl esterase
MILLALAASLAAPAAVASSPDADFATGCARLQGLSEGSMVVTGAHDIAEGPAPRGPSGPNGESTEPLPTMPRHCQITARLEQRTGAGGAPYYIGMELRVPAAWNGRFLYQGGGGMDGMIVPALGSPINTGTTSPLPLAQGYAVVSTDSGHQGKNFDDVSFAQDQQSKLDYGYAAIGKVSEAAKRLIVKIKGRAPDHSYFMGCSNGGREAMQAAQLFPGDFDGVLAGDPAFHLSAAAVLTNYSGWAYTDAATKLGTFLAAVLPCRGRADPVGFAQGLRWSRRCGRRHDLRPFRLPLRHRHAGLRQGANRRLPRSAQGSGDHPRLSRSGECRRPAHRGLMDLRYRQFHARLADLADRHPHAQGAVDGAAGSGAQISDAILRLSAVQAAAQGGDAEATLLAASAQTAGFTDATSTQYSSFAGHGGKLMLVTGWSDPVFSASDLTAYYDRLTADTKAQGGDASFARLFMVPGMTHCGGGVRSTISTR